MKLNIFQTRSEPFLLVVGLWLPGLLALAAMWSIHSYTVDDAYISFRYAQNLVDGHGLVYNPGESVEGYTNFLWTVLLAAAIKLGFGVEAAAKVMGGGFALLALVFVYRLSVLISPHSRLPIFATWLVAGNLVFMGYAVQGLESAMFSTLILAGTWCFFLEEREERAAFGSGILFALAGLTRPEAPLYLGLLMLMLPGDALAPNSLKRFIWAPEWRSLQLLLAVIVSVGMLMLAYYFWLQSQRPAVGSTLHWGIVLSALLTAFLGAVQAVLALPKALFSSRNLLRGTIFLVPILVHLVWRFDYYGAWLPNTLGAKTGSLAAQLAGGVAYVKNFLIHEGWLVLLYVFGVVLVVLEKSRQLLPLLAIVLMAFGYIVLVGGDWMPLFRFMVPVIPFLALFADWVIRKLLESENRSLEICTWTFLVMLVAQLGYTFAQDHGVFRKAEADWDRHAKGAAEWFMKREETHGRNSTEGTIALGDIGEIGFETNYPIMDLLGLVTPAVANLPGGYTQKTGPEFRDYFFTHQPRYVIIISNRYGCSEPSVPGSAALFHDPRFLRQYGVADSIWAGKDFFWCIYENKRQASNMNIRLSEGEKSEVMDPPRSDVELSPNTDIVHKNIDVLRIGRHQIAVACREACYRHSGCVAYTHGNNKAAGTRYEGICWLKRSSASTVSNALLDSGILRSPRGSQ